MPSESAAYTGLLDSVRTTLARADGVKAVLFGANSEGARARCKGVGLVYTGLAMTAGVATVCGSCSRARPVTWSRSPAPRPHSA